jgi:hypothetical protein
MRNDRIIQILSHIYDYKLIIVCNDVDNDDMAFQCNYQMIIFWTTFNNWCMVEKWLPCNALDNIAMLA